MTKKHVAAKLPQYTGASAAITREAAFAGTVALARLPRLAAQLADAQGELEASLALGREPGLPPRLGGQIRGRLPLVCQRCLEVFDWPLEAEVNLRLVQSEAEEARWLKDYEPYLIEDDCLSLHTIVEDEALLALPLAPRCERCMLAVDSG